MARARAVGINHVALKVGDLEQALEFYGRVFAVELRGRAQGMAFLDLGDQFLALSEGRRQGPDDGRHFGLVVEDREAVRMALEEAGIEAEGDLRVRDPWGNVLEIVDYREVQFTKAPEVLSGMGLDGLEKTEQSRRVLAEKGLGPKEPPSRPS